MTHEKTRLDILNNFYSETIPLEALFSQSEAKMVLPFRDAWWERKRVYGGGPAFKKIGSRVFYTKKSLLDFINRHKSVDTTSEEVAHG